MDHLDMLSSGNDPPRSPPDTELTYEPTDWTEEVSRASRMSQERPFYDDFPDGDHPNDPA